MNNPIEILSKIRQSGGTVQVEDGDLLVRTPGGSLSDEERIVLGEHKADLVRLLAPVDPEREAIQWAETADDDDLDQAVEAAVREWEEITTEPVSDH